MNQHNAIWFLLWAVLATVLLIGQYSLKLERENRDLHQRVSASIIPPTTANIRTP